jgi:histidyl-tRNA synthetase
MKPAVNTKVLSGFVELLPARQAVFDEAKEAVARAYRLHGFQPIETPIVDRAEVLFAKAGGDTEKEIYRVAKTGHDDLALRFDLTVPLARYVAEHYGELVFPFKCAQIGKSYRGERAQKGRFREFYQADVDVIAENELDVAYDAEVIATLADAIGDIAGRFSLGPFAVRVSNRKIWNDFFDAGGVDADIRAEIFSLLDHRLKMTAGEFDSALDRFGALAPKIRSVMAQGEKASPELARVMELLRAVDVPAVADLSIVRGLDYYTGTVFETFFDSRPELGSVASGGRYEGLVANFSDKNIVGVGGSIGLSRLLVPIIEDMKPEASGLDALLIPVEPEQFGYALRLEHSFASRGLAVSALLTGRKLKKNMEYANKAGAKYVLPLGEEEYKSGVFKLKNMSTGAQTTCSFDEVVEIIKQSK